MSRFGKRLQQAAAQANVGVPRLYITPSTGAYSVGSTFTIAIREDSQAVAVNAVQANLLYSTARLEFVAATTTTSPFTTEVQNSGGSGTVDIGVTQLGGSVTGDALVAVVTFKALSAGAAALSFAAGSAIASSVDSVDICRLQQGAGYTLS